VIGHSAEAALERPSRIGDYLPCRIATDHLTVLDDPLAPNGPANYEYDDENVRSFNPTVVVKDGILVARLHSQVSAKAANTLSTGNGRAASALNDALPRMSNLVCKAGVVSETEMINRIRNGILIHRLADGVNNGRKIEARVILAERIRNGKKSGTFVTGGRISEGIGVLLRTIDIGNNCSFNPNSLCGKAGQLLFDVGTFAPSIRLTRLRIVV
jgi:predicted Zn-dependent protease